MKRPFIAICFMACCLPPAVSQKSYAESVTTYLELDQDTLMPGEPVYFDFVMKNNSDKSLYVEDGGDYRNELGRPESFDVLVRDATGNPLKKIQTEFRGGGFIGFRQIAPYGVEKFRLFLPHWAKIETAGTYEIQVSKSFRMCAFNPREKADYSQIEIVPLKATAPLQVTPPDEKKMGLLIERLGRRLFESKNWDDQYTAAQRLRNINDARTIPWFVRAIKESPNSELINVSVLALGDFTANETAFKGLKEAANFVDYKRFLDHATTETLARSIPDHIRCGALDAVSKYHDKKALIEFLTSKQNDTSTCVKLKTMQTLYALDKEAVLPILEKYKYEADEVVRQEAVMFLEMIGTTGN